MNREPRLLESMVGSGPLRAINDARVVTPDGVRDSVAVVLEEGHIAGVFESREARGPILEAAGRYVLPGIVDLHTDALERQAMPRPGAHLPAEVAFLEADRMLALSGITTAFDAVAFMDANPRGISRAEELCAEVSRFREDGLVRHELHARCELTQRRAVDAVASLFGEVRAGGNARLVSVMDHTPGRGQFKDLASYERFYRKVRGADDEEFEAVLTEARRGGGLSLVGRFDRLAHTVDKAGAVLASHDDHSPEQVEAVASRGARISEFPVNLPAARRAKELEFFVCVGAPNALRGCSSSGNLSATEAIQMGFIDALASDYHPPAMLHAAFKLARDKTLSLPAATRLISLGPARAAGLSNRGEIREGALADLIVVREHRGLPEVTHVVVSGRVVLAVNATLNFPVRAPVGSCPTSTPVRKGVRRVS